ncbi:hypothetical protein LCGC14_2666000, partial [marine sediment metagenome]
IFKTLGTALSFVVNFLIDVATEFVRFAQTLGVNVGTAIGDLQRTRIDVSVDDFTDTWDQFGDDVSKVWESGQKQAQDKIAEIVSDFGDAVPASQSKFVIDRGSLIEALKEVALATTEDPRAVRVDLTPDLVRLSAESPEYGKSEDRVPAEFLSGGDSTIHTAFNPAYLLDALKSLDGEQVVIDIGQNGFGYHGKVFGKPAILYTHGNEATRCVVMPVNAGLPATRENLGSNYHGDAA